MQHDREVHHFVYSPASSYPKPYARLVDRHGVPIHSWSNDTEQPNVADSPPSFLRGWNHVEVDSDGNLLAIVPLQAVVKLDRDSHVVWKAGVAAHHDLDVSGGGEIHVLTEQPRAVQRGRHEQVILDNSVTVLDRFGVETHSHSLWDILRTDLVIAQQLDRNAAERQANFDRSGWPDLPDSRQDESVVDKVEQLLATGICHGDRRQSLKLLRQLPGSPCDVLHANSLEILGEHPHGVWQAGDLLLSLRNLNVVVVVDIRAGRVVWAWGNGVLSGQHQPSVLPNGNILVFDNGAGVGRSRLVEVDPATKKIVWEYVGDPPDSFFSPLAGGCEPLPGGNILVTQAQDGKAFEVTRTGQVVWTLDVRQIEFVEKVSRVTIYRMSAVPRGVAESVIE